VQEEVETQGIPDVREIPLGTHVPPEVLRRLLPDRRKVQVAAFNASL
jgi:hypothetical protein